MKNKLTDARILNTFVRSMRKNTRWQLYSCTGRNMSGTDEEFINRAKSFWNKLSEKGCPVIGTRIKRETGKLTLHWIIAAMPISIEKISKLIKGNGSQIYIHPFFYEKDGRVPVKCKSFEQFESLGSRRYGQKWTIGALRAIQYVREHAGKKMGKVKFVQNKPFKYYEGMK